MEQKQESDREPDHNLSRRSLMQRAAALAAGTAASVLGSSPVVSLAKAETARIIKGRPFRSRLR
ncbi:MAG TPA: twin-arginine translocation signal domain-containing protein, partial [Candidatus Binataceae bacterium]|nr:twin-arginine translocation signal domain-containing protein [Candidatus Binataceae bacterium]